MSSFYDINKLLNLQPLNIIIKDMQSRSLVKMNFLPLSFRINKESINWDLRPTATESAKQEQQQGHTGPASQAWLLCLRPIPLSWPQPRRCQAPPSPSPGLVAVFWVCVKPNVLISTSQWASVSPQGGTWGSFCKFPRPVGGWNTQREKWEIQRETAQQEGARPC